MKFDKAWEIVVTRVRTMMKPDDEGSTLVGEMADGERVTVLREGAIPLEEAVPRILSGYVPVGDEEGLLDTAKSIAENVILAREAMPEGMWATSLITLVVQLLATGAVMAREDDG